MAKNDDLLLQTRQTISRERYEWESAATPIDRYRRRAKEVKDPELRDFYLQAAEQQEALDRDLNRQLDEMTAVQDDRLFQEALDLGPTKGMQLRWLIEDAKESLGYYWEKLDPVMQFMVKHLDKVSISILVLCAVYGLGYCMNYDLGIHFFMGLLTGLVALGIWSAAKTFFNKGQAAVSYALSIAMSLGFILMTNYIQVFRPSTSYIGVEVTQDDSFVRVLDTTGFISPAGAGNHWHWYHSGGEYTFVIDENEGSTIYNNQSGKLSVRAKVALKEDFIPSLATKQEPNSGDFYWSDIDSQIREFVKEFKARGKRGVEQDINKSAAQLKLLNNNAYFLESVTMVFYPDSVAIVSQSQ